MPAEPQQTQAPETAVTGRCYCGAMRLRARRMPQTVAYCHCSDCRRWSGAPVAGFAAFAEGELDFTPSLGAAFSPAPGVKRWSCRDCGSPLAAWFDVLPGQIYVPLGLIDQAAELPPQLHCHNDARLPWLHIDDDLKRHGGSGRDSLTATTDRAEKR